MGPATLFPTSSLRFAYEGLISVTIADGRDKR